jgi:hypothetical protein
MKEEIIMNAQIFKKSIEKGQVLVLVVLIMFALIAMVALILDGGDIMSNRRTAQAAADSGALAGAQTICMGNPNPVGVAESYAVRNGASSAVATQNGKEISVAASVENASFFAKIFNEDTLVANADATAACFYPSVAKRVLPIAFFYQDAPINSDEIECTSDGMCDLVNWHFDDLMTGLSTIPMVSGATVNHPLDNIYVISDNTKVCEKADTGAVVCYDMTKNEAGGERTFVDLTELKGNPNNLANIVEDGLDDPIYLPAWVNTQTGVAANVYDVDYAGIDPIVGYESLEARLFFVPVFDRFCAGDPRVVAECEYESADKFDYLLDSSEYKENAPAYRLVGFAPFVVTGVTKNDTCTFGLGEPGIPFVEKDFVYTLGTGEITFGKNAEPCPGWANLKVQMEIAGEVISNNAIEGYFVDEFPANQYIWGTDGVDVGIYLISLSD